MMDKGIALLISSIALIVIGVIVIFAVDLMIAIPFIVAGVLGLISLKAFYRVVKPHEAHVRMFRNKKEVFIARDNQKLSYFEIPMVMQVIVLPLSIFSTPIDNYKFEDKNYAPFQSNVVPYFIVNNPLKASERVKDFKELYEQLQNITLSVSRSTMLKHTIREIMSDRQKIGGLIESEIKSKMDEFGVELMNFELVSITDVEEEGTHVIKDLNAAEEARIESDSRKLQAEKIASARLVEAERDEEARKREIMRDREVGIAEQKQKQEVQRQKQQAMTEEKKAVEIETIRQKEIDREAAELDGEAIQLKAIKVAEGHKESKLLEAEGDSKYIEEIGRAEGEKIAAAGVGKAKGIDAEAEAMQKYDDAAKFIKQLTITKDIQTAYAKALEDAKINAYMTGKPEGGIMGLLSPEGGANIGTALATYKDFKGDSGGLLDVISDKLNMPKEEVKQLAKTVLQGDKKEKGK